MYLSLLYVPLPRPVNKRFFPEEVFAAGQECIFEISKMISEGQADWHSHYSPVRASILQNPHEGTRGLWLVFKVKGEEDVSWILNYLDEPYNQQPTTLPCLLQFVMNVYPVPDQIYRSGYKLTETMPLKPSKDELMRALRRENAISSLSKET